MTQTEAEDIKIQIEELNKRFAPVELRFDMYRNDKYDSSEDNWWVTIVYNYTPEEWMEFVTIGFNYNQVCDKLFGFGFLCYLCVMRCVLFEILTGLPLILRPPDFFPVLCVCVYSVSATVHTPAWRGGCTVPGPFFPSPWGW